MKNLGKQRVEFAKLRFFAMHYVILLATKSFKPAIKAAWPFCYGPDHRQQVWFFNSLLSMCQALGFPAKTNPLANIIREASPQSLQAHFDHSAQPKLTQSKFLFDPGVGKLCYPSSLLIDLLSLFGLHLHFKRSQWSGLVQAQQRAPFFTPRTAASLKRAAPTIRGPRAVAPFHPAFLPLLGFKLQRLACR